MTEEPGAAYALTLSETELQRYALMADMARRAETDLWEQAGIRTGARIADVGCGPGGMFPALVAEVGETGQVVGVDVVPGTVEAAQALVAANGWANATVQVGAADATGLEPDSFDVVMMRHVLAHNGAREQAIVDHVATLLRPGGHLYLVDIDAQGMRIRPTEADVEDLGATYVRFHAEQGNDLETGLRLPELLTSAGLEPIAYRGWYNILTAPPGMRPPAWAARDAMVEAGFATSADVARWDAALERLGARAPKIFATLFGAVGRRASPSS